MKRLAIVLYNLGGPDCLEAVEPFLYNLFMDRAIIDQPLVVRWPLAKLISKRRAPFARDIYNHIGGKSPLLELTQAQADALQVSLEKKYRDTEVKCFICMRYWHPMSPEVAQKVKDFGPDQVVMLPLYPQFSTTTTGSSFDDWDATAARIGLTAPTKRICCFPVDPGFISAQAQLLKSSIDQARAEADGQPLRILFSAHGLPKKIIEKKSDPYPDQVQKGAAVIAAEMIKIGTKLEDWLVSYQSRVGPMEWIGPSTEDEIKRAGQDGVALVILPIAFVSEHSETLVELDIEYKLLADQAGVTTYVRVPALGTTPSFIDGLASLVQRTIAQNKNLCPAGEKSRICPNMASACSHQ
ncbi:MAG: ferrochelatase [Magnetovibrio sp.]|nr:ferrochelatase [Magnetovibrio sp.]